MTKCGKCGQHEGSWYNNRNDEMYCSKCVGDVNFLELLKILRERVDWLVDDNIVDNADCIQELRIILKKGESFGS